MQPQTGKRGVIRRRNNLCVAPPHPTTAAFTQLSMYMPVCRTPGTYNNTVLAGLQPRYRGRQRRHNGSRATSKGKACTACTANETQSIPSRSASPSGTKECTGAGALGQGLGRLCGAAAGEAAAAGLGPRKTRRAPTRATTGTCELREAAIGPPCEGCAYDARGREQFLYGDPTMGEDFSWIAGPRKEAVSIRRARPKR